MGGGGVVHVTCSKLKLRKYVSTEENDDILEGLKAVEYMVPRRMDLV
jgi:hypothetical protein